MRLPGQGMIAAAGRRLRQAFYDTGVILVYHRIHEAERDPQLLCVSRRNFLEHLEVLRKHTRIFRLSTMATAIADGTLPRRSVAITFDDGYADNLHEALPVLRQSSVPATVFVATGQIDSSEEFWWDEVEGLLLAPGRLPAELTITAGHKQYTWTLGPASEYSERDSRRHHGWNVEQEAPTARQEVYRDLCDLLRPLSAEERCRAIGDLRTAAGRESRRAESRALGAEELRKLASTDLVEIGAHGVTHSILSKLPQQEQERELRRSKARLEEILNRRIIGFAYPFGSKPDFTKTTARFAERVGFEYACANYPDTVWKGSNRYALPRLLVRDWSGDRFNRRLHDWLDGRV